MLLEASRELCSFTDVHRAAVATRDFVDDTRVSFFWELVLPVHWLAAKFSARHVGNPQVIFEERSAKGFADAGDARDCRPVWNVRLSAVSAGDKTRCLVFLAKFLWRSENNLRGCRKLAFKKRCKGGICEMKKFIS